MISPTGGDRSTCGPDRSSHLGFRGGRTRTNTTDLRAGRPPLARQQRGGGGCQDPASRTPRKLDLGHRRGRRGAQGEKGVRRFGMAFTLLVGVLYFTAGDKRKTKREKEGGKWRGETGNGKNKLAELGGKIKRRRCIEERGGGG